MRTLLILIPLLALFVSPAGAGQTAWQEVAPDVAMRLISTGTVTPEGQTLLGLEIDMPADTKTYWRVPGSTGLPTRLDFSASQGVAGHRIIWPYPVREQKDGYLDYVYFGPTVLPIAVNLDAPAGEVDLLATLGICSDICVPAQARFTLPVRDGEPDRANGLRLRQAQAAAPIAWEEEPAPFGAVEFLPQYEAIGVWVTDSEVDIASLIAATDSGVPLLGAPKKSPQDRLVLLPILEKTENTSLEGQDVQLTFMTDQGAYELRRTIGAATDTK